MNKVPLVMIIAACAFAFGGCKKQALDVNSIAELSAGEFVRVEGRLSLRGSVPAVEFVLVQEQGPEVLIDGQKLHQELLAIADLPVAIEGEVGTLRGRPAVNAVRYRLLRLPSGELPVVGTLVVDGNHVVLLTPEGRRLWMRGDLVSVLRDYADARVWIIGALGDQSQAGGPANAAPYWVTGYGVISVEPHAIR